MEMAMADTPITEIMPELLIGRLRFAFDNWLSGGVPPEKVAKFKAEAGAAVRTYYSNNDHGYGHSCAVYCQAKEIAGRSPKMMNLALQEKGLTPQQGDWVLTWASVLHDLMRFFGYDTRDHEAAAGELARAAFWKDCMAIEEALAEAVVCHDYFCPIVNGEPMPLLFMKAPLTEIIRLADKTSISPVAEVNRWWEYGQRQALVFFNPDLPDAVRFDLQGNYGQRDFVTFLLAFFALQPSDFYAEEAASAYRQWARDKAEALRRILALAREQRVSERTVMEIIKRFHDCYNLPMPEGSKSLRVYS